MPLNNERPSVGDDQISDTELSERCDSVTSSSDYECSRQSFTSDSSSKLNSPASSPPQVVTFDELMAATGNFSNLTLAHEIVVNDNFRIDEIDLPPNSLERRVKEVVHKAFWDCLESELKEDPPEYEHAMKLLEEIKEILLSFLSTGANRLRNQICEVLDIDLLRQQAEHDTVDIRGLAGYVITIMGKLCAPVRDEDVKKLKATTDIVPLFREIFHVLDLMKMDMINFTIQNLRPHLQHHSVEYERETFQQILDTLPSGLDHTTEWIKESVDEVSASVPSAPSSSPGAECHSNSIPSPTSVLNNGFLKLLHWDYEKKVIPEEKCDDLENRSCRSNIRIVGIPEGMEGRSMETFVESLLPKVLGEDTFPRRLEIERAHRALRPRPGPGERPRIIIAKFLRYQDKTLMTDETRFRELQQRLDQLKTVAAVLVITYNMLNSAIEGLPEFANRLKKTVAILLDGMHSQVFNLEEALKSIGIQICSEVNKSLLDRGCSVLSTETQGSLIGQLCSIPQEDNPIRNLINDRIQLYLKKFLSISSSSKCAPPVPGGLSAIQSELELIGAQYASVVNFNKQVYGPFYAGILRKLLFTEAPRETAPTGTNSL
nr:PREDICTED: T-complex protein 11-like protein 2 isoform X2 [Latimeria chalumnae]XP_014341219.1 PREDICTED: T-complex protein 11-like protein 2 isoform X2 [Latimeria chalumnae]XP_014341220.1 PREDICTED: T-complex protein 11-like protein 2 isoform X2 [Latimeria chalumnae]XP_014341221.1 PREDICTED: T-complex protein 11-like protein 2 isoform X2 [Latimeria chalumnae]|eukprot:XP_005991374.1 PREDICTED: T-complex protein 11-like protein 2 isoform X2 [Latimeria chalumnae]